MATSSVPITPGTGQNIAVDTNAGLASGAAVQIMALANPDGSRLPNDPDGTLQVANDPTALFLDDFSTALSNNWTLGGTVVPTSASGTLNTSQVTTVSMTSYLRSNGTFLLRPSTYLRIAFLVQINAAAVTNNARWWGYGQNQGTPASGAPVLNGAVFQLETDGTMKASTYSNGTRNNVITITRPSDNAFHRYEIFYRQSVIYFVIDGVTMATITQPNLAVATNMYLIAGSANFTTAPSAAPQLSISAATVSDASRTNHTISDGINPYIQGTVKASATITATTDFAQVVALHPSSPLPGGANVLGSIRIQGAGAAYSAVTTASTNAAVIKASSGYLQELTISNPTATAVYVKLYNLAVAPTVGTSVPIATIRVPATGSAGDFSQFDLGANGKLFSTGIAIAVTAAAAATDTAVAAAGVQIHGTYV